MLSLRLWQALLIVLALIGCTIVYWFLVLQGRALVTLELERVTGKKVSIREARPVFPPGFVFEDVRIEGLAAVPKVRVVINIQALLNGRAQATLVELEAPVINLDLRQAPAAAGSVSEGSLEMSVAVTAPELTRDKAVVALLRPSGRVGRVKVNKGVLMVQAPSTGKTWIFEDVNAEASPVSFEHEPLRTDFTVTASLARMNIPFIGHLAKARGWVNWPARDLDASVEAVDENGQVGLRADLKSRANECQVTGRARLSSSQSVQASGKKPKMVESAMLDLLRAMKTDIEANFDFHTALDRFEIGKVSVSGNITTGLQSEEISGNIVGSLKAAGAQLLEKDAVPTVDAVSTIEPASTVDAAQ